MDKEINFVILDDVEEEFKKYSGIIKAIFKKLRITGNQILDNHSSVLDLIRLYRGYIGNANKLVSEKTKLDVFIKEHELKTLSIIYIIDDNWSNSGNNHDGTNFFKDFLLTDENKNSNSRNAIVLTNYTACDKYLQMQYACKLSDNIDKLLKIQISNTMVYEQCMANNNTPDDGGKGKLNYPLETDGITGDQARSILNTQDNESKSNSKSNSKRTNKGANWRRK